MLQVPRTRTEEEWSLELLTAHDVLVQPGFFFDFETEAFLVVSLLTPPRDVRRRSAPHPHGVIRSQVMPHKQDRRRGRMSRLLLGQWTQIPAQKKFALTIDNIMRGPGLYGYEPTAVRWSGDSAEDLFSMEAGERSRRPSAGHLRRESRRFGICGS